MNPQDPSFIQYLLQALRQTTFHPNPPAYQPPSATPATDALGQGVAQGAAGALQGEEARRQQQMREMGI